MCGWFPRLGGRTAHLTSADRLLGGVESAWSTGKTRRVMTCWAEKWRDKVLEAFDASDIENLNQLALASIKHRPSAADLLCGAGFLLQDTFVWKNCSDDAQKMAARAFSKWKIDMGAPPKTSVKPAHPLGPLRT